MADEPETQDPVLVPTVAPQVVNESKGEANTTIVVLLRDSPVVGKNHSMSGCAFRRNPANSNARRSGKWPVTAMRRKGGP